MKKKKHFKLHEAGGEKVAATATNKRKVAREKYHETLYKKRKKDANGCPLKKKKNKERQQEQKSRATHPEATQADEPPKQPN